ncbi:hypothetical protein [Actinocorallia longicatena]|uniref:Uncharacterized protein n=1 Tax=Actinocorallia longicatena TaxID=111803 RepID=A0ABP6QIG8_9ACTN
MDPEQVSGEDEAIVELQSELYGDGLDLDFEEGMWHVSGSFSNPLPIAARVATRLEAHMKLSIVQARSKGRWAFIVWRRPDLLVATAPSGNAWRLYRVDGHASPTTLLSSGEGLSSVGLVGKPTRIGQLPPQRAMDLLGEAGLDYVELIGRLTTG